MGFKCEMDHNKSAICGLLEKDNDLRASHLLLNTERILWVSQIGAERVWTAYIHKQCIMNSTMYIIKGT